MAQVWSVSQNKFVDSGGTGTSTPSNGGDTSSALKSILLMEALNNPKKASQISTILNMLPTPSADEVKRTDAKKLAAQNIDQLEQSYFGNKLHQGGVRGAMTTWFGTKLDPYGPYGQYRNLVNSMRPTFARAAGDVGNLSLQEQLAQGRLFPTARATRAEAIKSFDAARVKFGLPAGDYSSYGGVSNTSDYLKKYSQ